MKSLYQITVLNISIVLLIIPHSLHAQGNEALERGVKYFELGAYPQAIVHFEEGARKSSPDQNTMVKLADSYFYTNQLDKAKNIYSRALLEVPNDPELLHRFGNTLFALGQYKDARIWFQEVMKYQFDRGRNAMAACDWVLMQDETSSSTGSLTLSELNSKQADFSPIYSPLGVLLCSARDPEGKRTDTERAWTMDAYDQLYKTSSKGVSNYFDRSFMNQSNIGPLHISADGKWVAITKNNFVRGVRMIPHPALKLDLYLIPVNTDGTWGDAVAFPFNSATFSNGYPWLNKDGSEIFYASNKSGGFGGFDIFRSKKVNGEWQEPKNLGSNINTPGHEIAPHLYQERSMTFSSDWHSGFGGYDVFYANYNNDEWKNIRNAGRAVNSRFDESQLILKKLGNSGILVSNRPNGKGEEDLYLFEGGSSYRPKTITATKRPSKIIAPESELPTVPERVPSDPTDKQAFVIQIGAFSTPDYARLEPLKSFGSVYTMPMDHLQLILIGPYASIQEASAAKDRVRGNGYPDAFIKMVTHSMLKENQLDLSSRRAVTTPATPPKQVVIIDEPKPVVAPQPVKRTSRPGNYYKIQLGAFRDPSNFDHQKFMEMGSISEIRRPNGLTVLLLGSYNRRSEVDRALLEVKSLGIKDAFVVKYVNGVRIN